MPRGSQLSDFLSLKRQPKKPRGRRKKKEPLTVRIVSPQKGVRQIRDYAKQVGKVPRFSTKSLERQTVCASEPDLSLCSIVQAAKSLPSSLDLQENLTLHSTVICDAACEPESESEVLQSMTSIPDSDDQGLIYEGSAIVYLECSDFSRPRYATELDDTDSFLCDVLDHSRGCVASSEDEGV